jgi:hypothetical protein
MSQLRKSSSAASQPHNVNEINHLHDWTLAELLSAVPSVVCAGQAALDDLRNWLTWFNSLRTFSSSSNIDVRISWSSHRFIIARRQLDLPHVLTPRNHRSSGGSRLARSVW